MDKINATKGHKCSKWRIHSKEKSENSFPIQRMLVCVYIARGEYRIKLHITYKTKWGCDVDSLYAYHKKDLTDYTVSLTICVSHIDSAVWIAYTSKITNNIKRLRIDKRIPCPWEELFHMETTSQSTESKDYRASHSDARSYPARIALPQTNIRPTLKASRSRSHHWVSH